VLECEWESQGSTNRLMESRGERRREPRRRASYPVTVTPMGESGGIAEEAVVYDINSRGLRFLGTRALPPEQSVQLCITLDRLLAGQNRAIQVMAVGRVVRSGTDSTVPSHINTAIEFVRPLALSLEERHVD